LITLNGYLQTNVKEKKKKTIEHKNLA